jgi:hypothetical protein
MGGNGTGQGTESLPVRLWLEQVTLSESERESIDPIVFGDLSEAEQDLVWPALDEGEYTAEPGTESAALERLRERIETRTGDGETLKTYLGRGETLYRVGFADGDHIIAHPDH